ncbi:hypothetical protein GCM10022215_04150 [Nocardioides fonticola]|uniref:PqqD family protein n=1 Tax=Nocardioides fonticola TaxID=450363 RepID=A0ABP7XAP6_9ACTN
MGNSDVPRRRVGIAAVERPGRVAVLDTDRLAQAPVILLGLAADVWRTVDGSRSRDDIARELASLWDTTPGELTEVVAEALDALVSCGFIERVRSADSDQ